MREIIELGLREELAKNFFDASIGEVLGVTRKIRVSTNDPLYIRVSELDKELLAKNQGSILFFWNSYREYSERELRDAEVFYLKIDQISSELVGEDFGTTYDESTTCEYCGAGRKQVSEFSYDLRILPKGKDIVRTLTEEWVVSERLAGIINDHQITGLELRPIKQAVFTKRVLPNWYQLRVKSQPISMVTPTKFGISPLDSDVQGVYRCPVGHVAGLNVLSEIFLSRGDWDTSDVNATLQKAGYRPKDGVLVPSPLLLISPKLYRILKDEKIKGYKVEVAYLK